MVLFLLPAILGVLLLLCFCLLVLFCVQKPIRLLTPRRREAAQSQSCFGFEKMGQLGEADASCEVQPTVKYKGRLKTGGKER